MLLLHLSFGQYLLGDKLEVFNVPVEAHHTSVYGVVKEVAYDAVLTYRGACSCQTRETTIK
jgi:hypothetical protein